MSVEQTSREVLRLPGGTSTVEIKLDAAVTGGELSAIEFTVQPGGGAPPHRHHREAETIVVLEGELTLEADGVRRLGTGDVAFMPRGVLHSFENDGAGEARVLFLATPAGLEEFFRAIGVPAGSAGAPEPDSAAIAAAAERAGLEFPA